MKNPIDLVASFVEDLIRGRRPKRFRVASEDVEALSAAAKLASLRPGVDLPDRQFIDRLGRQLREAMAPLPVRHVMSRRVLLQSAGLAAAAGVAGAVVERTLVSQPSAEQGTLIPNDGSWRPVAALTQLSDGQALPFSTGSIHGVLVNNAGVISALSAVCTHQGCLLRLDSAARLLRCPCHPTAFALNGSVTSSHLPAPPPRLPKLQSRVRDGSIEVFAV